MLPQNCEEKTLKNLSVTLNDIQHAHQRIQGTLGKTPITRLSCPRLDRYVYLKMETFHRTGSFKERGALNTLLQIQAKTPGIQIIGASAGNHAQAVSYHGSKLGFPVQMLMPKNTPINKILATKKWGAAIELEGSTVDEGMTIARDRAKKEGFAFVHAFDDPRIIAGQGTMALELLEDLPDLDVLVMPVGGGGYLSGVATAIKALKPSVRIIGVQTEVYPQVSQAYAGVEISQPSGQSTIADGIAVKGLGEHTIPLLQAYVDEMVLVTDEEIAHAIAYLLKNRKILAEGAGAAGFAALLARKIQTEKDQIIATPICGGNIDMNLLVRVLERGFLKSKRLLSLNVVISDRPGSLHGLTKVLADLRVNILQIQHDRASTEIPYYNTGTDLLLETLGQEHAEEIIAALQAHCQKVTVYS
jgi:threonine dehydratase